VGASTFGDGRCSELLDGIADGAGSSTASLAPDSAAGRLRELAGGVGERP
jgi:hypothetical protein